MVGKKVLTDLGERLANFFTKNNIIKGDINKLETQFGISQPEDIDPLNTTSPEEQAFFDLHKITQEELLSHIKEIVHREKKTVSKDSLPMNVEELTQLTYNNLMFLTAKNEAQFTALQTFITKNLAGIIKSVGNNHRVSSLNIAKTNQTINNLGTKTLDYFAGSQANKAMVYFKTMGQKIVASNGNTNDHKFAEVLRVETSGARLSDTITIGGPSNEQITKITLNKPTTVRGNLTLSGGELIGTAMSARFNDVAEWYITDREYLPGELLMVCTDQDTLVQAVLDTNKRAPLMGIVSKEPGILINEKVFEVVNRSKDLFATKIALCGQVEVRFANKPLKGQYVYRHKNGKAISVSWEDKDSYDILDIHPLGIVIDNPIQDSNNSGEWIALCKLY